MSNPQVCQVGSLFARCREPAIQVCQYCARPFCSAHAYYLQDHEAVCTRKPCRARRDDLVAHLEYRRVVAARNGAGLCGIETCGPHPTMECSLCHGRFCSEHLRERLYPFRQGRVTVERPVSACARCWQRRKIWRGA
ncbi:hypothetical protein [Tepidiforma sp.]|uniref:hypothetical protein n=1 Tax=Tepidiforma sp. TaxID=2682230 RepID=UPI002ADDFE8A|nr:hypothetical protein [Tepidiforma sp.]